MPCATPRDLAQPRRSSQPISRDLPHRLAPSPSAPAPARHLDLRRYASASTSTPSSSIAAAAAAAASSSAAGAAGPVVLGEMVDSGGEMVGVPIVEIHGR